MKRILISTILLIFLLITRVNASVLTYDKTITVDNNIDNIIEVNNNYITINDNQLIKYDKNFNIEATKLLEETHYSNIINFNNKILLVGNKNNFINIYLLNTDLQVENSVETTILYNKPNLYYYDNHIYMVLGEDYILEDNNMYEIDDNLNINSNNISSYGAELIKSIMNSDYYAFNNPDILETITSTTYNVDYNVLSVSKDDNKYLRIIDKDNNTKEIVINNSINDLMILNNKIISLTDNGITIYNMDLVEEETIELSSYKYFIKLKDNILLINNNEISIYTFNINIENISNDFGTLEIAENAKPNTKVSYTITPNSGYEVENIIITDEYGNVIKTNGDSFIAPSSDVKVLAEYKESVLNPDTIDLITIIVVISVITLLIFVKIYKKYQWIKN